MSKDIQKACHNKNLGLYISKHSDENIYNSLNQLLLESERLEVKRCVSGHLIQPIFWLFFLSCPVCFQRTQKQVGTNFGTSFWILIILLCN